LSAPTASAGAAVGSRQCLAGTTGAFTYVIGAPEPGHTIEDGKAGVMVTCFVDASIDGTSEDISLMASGIDQNGAKPVSVSLSAAVPLDGNGAAVSEPAPATLTFFSPDTGHLSTLEPFPSCTLGPATVLKRGAMLADVDCALIGSVDDVTNGCRVHGTIAIEYCQTNAATDPSPSGSPLPSP
jgi:hypothetical protein